MRKNFSYLYSYYLWYPVCLLRTITSGIFHFFSISYSFGINTLPETDISLSGRGVMVVGDLTGQYEWTLTGMQRLCGVIK